MLSIYGVTLTARLRQANRLFARSGSVSKLDLMTIEAEDILASSMFANPLPDTAS